MTIQRYDGAWPEGRGALVSAERIGALHQRAMGGHSAR